jgi:MerR family transcriptional regulator, redox-sensitive transcriptional activator SoxR
MPRLSISDVARRMRLRPSAIRYYEKLGILPKPERVSGKRCYDGSVLYRLAVIQQAREAGFRLPEIRALFFGFQERTRADARWRRMADRKLTELDRLARQIRRMRILLEKMKANCHCKTLEVCGKAIFEKGGISRVERPPLPVAPNARVVQETIRS